MSQIRDKHVRADNPLLTVLGRRGRGAIIDVLASRPDTHWSVRDLARGAGVAAMVASRAVTELQALGAVEYLRPGRDGRVRWLADAPAARALAAIDPPDLRRAAAQTFAGAYHAPSGARRVLLWQAAHENPADPLVPTRLAILALDDDAEEDALDAAGPALDAIRAAGLPAPDVTTLLAESLDDRDPAAAAVRAGTPIEARGR